MTEEQTAALVKYANTHGRYWKAALGTAWETGVYSSGDNVPALQSIRNERGPTFLRRVSLRALQEQHATNQSK